MSRGTVLSQGTKNAPRGTTEELAGEAEAAVAVKRLVKLRRELTVRSHSQTVRALCELTAWHPLVLSFPIRTDATLVPNGDPASAHGGH